MLFDTHAHLIDPRFDEDREAVLERAREAGVVRIVEIADSPEEWDRALALCRARPGFLRCSLGLHPYYADRWTEPLGARLKSMAALPEVVAAGEIGLDYAKCGIPKDVQLRSMERMLEAADAAGLPVVLHCRDAYMDMVPALRSFYAGRALPAGRRYHGVVHCFSGNVEEAEACAGLGFALGADGPVTYPKNEGLRAALRAAGLDALVLETDSPWLPPQSRRGKRNEPALVAEVAERLADVFETDKEKVAGVTTRNACDLFGLEPVVS